MDSKLQDGNTKQLHSSKAGFPNTGKKLNAKKLLCVFSMSGILPIGLKLQFLRVQVKFLAFSDNFNKGASHRRAVTEESGMPPDTSERC